MADSPSELQFEIEKLERRHAEHPEGRFFVPLANAYRKMGDLETAEALLRSGVERHPDYLSAHIVLGRCLADRGAVREAEEEFRFVLSEDPQNLIALRTLGELASADGRPREAAEWYRELLAVDPMNEDARQALEMLSDEPSSAEAEAEFQSGAGWWESGADAADAAAQSTPPTGDPREGGATASASDPESRRATEEGSARRGPDDLPELRSEVDSRPGGGDSGSDWPALDAEQGLERFEGWEQGQEPASPPAAESSTGADRQPHGDSANAEPEPVAAGFVGDELGLEDEDSGAFPADESSEVVTETIAELYARQGLHERAAEVYRELIRRRGGDRALEQRLEELERRGREEMASDSADLTLEDDEALPSPPIDADDDQFAASFADGFTRLYDEPEESVGGSESSDEPVAPEVERSRPDAELEHAPVAETAMRRGEATAPPADVSIVRFLSDLSSWRPVEAPAAVAEGPPVPSEEPPFGGPEASAPIEEVPAETGGETEPTSPSDFEARIPEAGTGPADDEPFPWELPGGAGPSAEAPADEPAKPTELDPYMVDDVEPTRPAAEGALPEAAPEPPPAGRQEPEPKAAESDPNEDEDLESFQAWLRSLKR